MDATAIALLITTIGSLITAGATALAGLRQSRAALLAAERAEKQAAEAEARARAPTQAERPARRSRASPRCGSTST